MSDINETAAGAKPGASSERAFLRSDVKNVQADAPRSGRRRHRRVRAGR